MEEISYVAVFQALCDENRLKILCMLRDGEKNATVLLRELSVCQPTLSHHMKILCEAGIVTSRRWGRQTLYTIRPEGIKQARLLLEQIENSVSARSSQTPKTPMSDRQNQTETMRRSEDAQPALRPPIRKIENYLL